MAVEGIEGSGKSTLLALLADALAARGFEAVQTREPGGTPFGDMLRQAFIADVRIDPVAEAFAVNASRAQHVAEIIEPSLERGAWVLCDRFTAATLAYQGYGRGLDVATLRALATVATCGREPDLTLLLDIPIAVSRARIAARSTAAGNLPDRLEREDEEFHARVREGYLTLARSDRGFVVLDASRSPNDLLIDALAAIAEKLGT